MITLYNSFERLLTHIHSGRFLGDTTETLYYFNIAPGLQPILDIAANWNYPEENLESVLQMLVFAERDGRVWWASGTEREKILFFMSMLQKARRLGAAVPEWSPYHGRYSSAHWDIYTMDSFLFESVFLANPI